MEINETPGPGAARLGNFINYYQFNPANKRIDHIPSDLLENYLSRKSGVVHCLDIGCNSGVSNCFSD